MRDIFIKSVKRKSDELKTITLAIIFRGLYKNQGDKKNSVTLE